MERERVAINHCVNAELGARRELVAELPNATISLHTEDAVSAVAAPVACCKLAWYEPWEHVSDGDYGEDMFSLQNFTEFL